MNQHTENKIKTDVNFRFFHKTRRRIHHALNGKLKSSSTLDIFGLDIDIYRKRIEFQMTADLNWKSIDIDQVRAFSFIDISNDGHLKGAFCWKNTQHLS